MLCEKAGFREHMCESTVPLHVVHLAVFFLFWVFFMIQGLRCSLNRCVGKM